LLSPISGVMMGEEMKGRERHDVDVFVSINKVGWSTADDRDRSRLRLQHLLIIISALLS